MQIQPGMNAVRLLQAQQAFQARRAETPVPEAQQDMTSCPPADGLAEAEARMPVNPALDQLTRSPQWRQTVDEVSRIAQRAGYVGLNENDIQRAYVYGESLLADYRV